MNIKEYTLTLTPYQARLVADALELLATPPIGTRGAIAWDLVRVVRQSIAAAEQHGSHSVWHDGAWDQIGSEPLAICQAVERKQPAHLPLPGQQILFKDGDPNDDVA